MKYQDLLDRWIAQVDDEMLAQELVALKEAGDSAIEDAFYQELSFGTGGLRGILGAGTNRMNIYTVGRATQGIARYLKEHPELPQKVAICYDSRINSRLFAHRSACVLAANGIPSFVYPRLEPTPALSFATRYLGCGIGINVTASHNPSQYNGYKVYGPDGCQITDEIADGITNAIASIDIFDDVLLMPLDKAIEAGLVSFMSEEVIDSYLDAVYAQDVVDPACADGDLRVVYTPLNGTGLECVTRILERIGVRDVYVVEEQSRPDGTFPTCPYPNPEIREALECGIALCERVNPDLLLATDPDADRVGIAIKDGGEYRLMTGNEVGVLLLNYLCEVRQKQGTLPVNPCAVTTIVSTSMVDAIAQTYGVEIKRVLTGFKWIGGVIADLEKAGQKERFIFGFEESYGYLAGTHARDKDAIVASMLICQMARYYRAQNKNLYQVMQELYAQYGYYQNKTVSLTFEGAAGAKKMSALMDSLRSDAPASFAGYAVEEVKDYKGGYLGLPDANVVEFDLAGGNKVIVRPSGTEPKIKIYLFARGETLDEAHEIIDVLANDVTVKFQ